MHEAKGGEGAGLAIMFGNIVATIPGRLVIGADFAGFETLLPNAWPPAHSSASWVTSSERAVIDLGPLDDS